MFFALGKFLSTLECSLSPKKSPRSVDWKFSSIWPPVFPTAHRLTHEVRMTVILTKSGKQLKQTVVVITNSITNKSSDARISSINSFTNPNSNNVTIQTQVKNPSKNDGICIHFCIPKKKKKVDNCMIPIPTLALVQASSTACCKGGLHGYRSAMTSTIR